MNGAIMVLLTRELIDGDGNNLTYDKALLHWRTRFISPRMSKGKYKLMTLVLGSMSETLRGDENLTHPCMSLNGAVGLTGSNANDSHSLAKRAVCNTLKLTVDNSPHLIGGHGD